MRIPPPSLLRLATFLLLILPCLKLGDLKPHERTVVSIAKNAENDTSQISLGNVEPATSKPLVNQVEVLPETGNLSRLVQHLDMGLPLTIQISKGASRTAWLRPVKTTADDFQITKGHDHNSVLNVSRTKTWGGFVGNFHTPIFVSVVGESLAAHVVEKDGTTHSIYVDSVSGHLVSETRLSEHAQYVCSLDPRTRLTAAKIPEGYVEPTPIRQNVTIEAVNKQAGQNPATNEYDRSLDHSPGGSLYEDSLKNSYLLLVLDKSVTGSDDTENLTSVTAQYLARVASLSSVYEQQIGTRLLLQELVLIPNTAAYTDIVYFTNDNNQSILEFRKWVELHRPLTISPHTYATKVGEGLSGSTLGLAYTNSAGTILSCNLLRKGYDYALQIHEIGHNLGTTHTSGGVMNASYIAGEHTFYTFTEAKVTAARHIYDGSKNDLEGPASLRHPEEIPFALNDFARTDPDKAVIIKPLENDLSSVPGGQINTHLEIAETGPIFPIGSATLEQDGDQLILTPSGEYEGLVWFSYTLRGNVGNDGKGWLHKADVAVLVGEISDQNTLTLRPGDTHVHIPNGSGEITLQTLPTQANATRSIDNTRAIILQADEDASGTDTLTFEKNGQIHELTIQYSAEGTIQTLPDVFVLNAGETSIRFNPTQNDSFSGTRTAHVTQPSLGTTDTSIDVLPNGYTLTSATLETSDKGTLEIEKHTYYVNGSTQQQNTGFLKFTPRVDATGIAEISYTLKDAAGNTASETILIYLSLHTISTPRTASLVIWEKNQLKLEFTSHASEIEEITGAFTHLWSVQSKPLHATVNLVNEDQPSATVSFSHPGTYTLQLKTADAHGRLNSSTRTIQVLETGASAAEQENLGPQISLPAGLVSIPQATLSSDVFSPVVVDSDGPALVPNFLWAKISGPGNVNITSPHTLQTFFQFSQEGEYVLRLSANDGDVHTFRDLQVHYQSQNAGQPTAIGIAPVDLPINSPLYSIDLADLFEDTQDTDEELSFSLISPLSSELFQTLQVTSDPDKLQIQPALNQTGTIDITVGATDTDGNSATNVITVSIRNHPPTLADSLVELNENSPEGTPVTTLSPINPDGDTLEFSILSSTPFSNTFSLNPDSGAITVAESANLDFENNPRHTLVVSVTDAHQQHTPRTATLIIDLIDVNEPPSLTSEILVVTSLETEEFTLKTLFPTDPEGHEIFLQITEGNEDGRYSIDAENNLLFNPVPSFDIYTSPRHSLTLEVTDSGVPPITTETTIQVDFHECLNPPDTYFARWFWPTNAGIDSTWITLHYNHNAWQQGKMPMGFDTSANYDPYIVTDTQSKMYQKTSSLYVRIPFEISDISKIGMMYLMADFDDGMAVYLNGNVVPILRKNAPSTLGYTSTAIADQSATPPDQIRYDLKDYIPLLINGNNVLCIHLLNSHSHDADAFLNAQLYVSAIGTASAPGGPSIQISGAGFPGRTSLSPSGSILNNGGEQPTVVLVLDTEDKGENPELWTHKFTIPSFTGNSFQQTATGLLPGTTYHYGFYAVNSGGIGWTSTNNTSSTRSNKTPIPTDDAYAAEGGVPLVIELNNSLLKNDSDPEGDTILSTLLTAPLNGSLQLNTDGTFTYTADPSFTGTDTFQYLASDPYDFAETEHTWIAKGDSWKYLDTNTPQHYTWRRLDFNDSTWSSGTAEFGYGDGDEDTTLSFGNDSLNKTPTYYFRKGFTLPADAYVTSAKLRIKRDDAAVISLNGEEFHRDENLGHTYTHSNYASSETTEENTYALFSVPPELLKPGDNLLAAEVHQASPTNDDLSFDLELTGVLRKATTVTITVTGSDPEADSDADGLSNFLEYALGSDPTSSTPHSEVAPTLNFSGSTIDFIYKRAKTSLTYTVESSTDLQTWTEPTALFTNVNDNGDGSETVTHTYNRNGSENMFLRIRISSE